MKIYLMKTQHHDLFARYVQLVQYKSPLSGHGLYIFFPQAAQQLQVHLNNQWNLAWDLQHKFDDISNTTPTPDCHDTLSGGRASPNPQLKMFYQFEKMYYVIINKIFIKTFRIK